MNARILALGLLATPLLLLAPLPVVAVAGVVGLALLTRRRAFLLFTLLAAAIQSASFYWFTGDPVVGVVVTVRYASVLAVNMGALARYGPARFLDDLGLPAGPTAFLAAVLIAAQDLARDAQAITAARRYERRAGGRLMGVASLIPTLMAHAHRRGTSRAEALRLAGHSVGPHFAAIVAVAGLAAAGRLITLGIPNVAPTYVLVFAAGVLWGPRAAAAGGFLGMAITDVMISGLLPTAFVNAPAMAALGLLGGLLRSVPWHTASGRVMAAAIGVLATFAFSVAADFLTWVIVPDVRGQGAALVALLAAGVAFNLPAAAVNAVLFAATLPLLRPTTLPAPVSPHAHREPEGPAVLGS